MEQEKQEILASGLLPLKNTESVPSRQIAIDGETQGEGTIKSLTFRSEPIAWLTVPKTKIVIRANAIGEDYAEEQADGVRHLIEYQNKQQERGEFLQMVFPDYRKYPYKVQFKNDDVFRLGGN